MKKAIYTVVTGGYDEIVTPPFVDQDTHYYCFTDSPDSLPYPWVKIPYQGGKELHYMQRERKILGTLHFENYDAVLYHDGYLHQLASLDPLFQRFATSGADLLTMRHPDRDCVYDEISACITRQKAPENELWHQCQAYKGEDIPAHGGLIASGVLIRNFQNPQWSPFAQLWYKEICTYTHRDQIAFAAVDHRHPLKKELVPWEDVIGKLFDKVSHRINKLY